ncbi:MAG: phenylalanine--tRNA ligase subunit alpha [Candidatus Methanomethylicia archaeon]|jgi:phenylalanyl-tRNA synthetase alpha chain|nr:phenylalanine--tRNA ligase subunit alpha [Candidatus Methanomethylicia archaeon]MCQ5340478.1 phenylalanine--tRNA ligase subunit alpha [Candidatus Methanomethylicia archaeon]NHV45709.1 phenylalanine--tRNA ligase subunit alpha [Candidatus Verstraetearchaeota archaeon]
MALSQSEIRFIEALKELGGKSDAESLSKKLNEPISSIFPISKLLEEKGYIITKELIKESYELTEEGKNCLINGLPETRVYKMLISSESIDLEYIKKFLNEKEIAAAIGWGKQTGVFEIDKISKRIILKKKEPPVLDSILKKLSEGESLTSDELNKISELEKRGLIKKKITKSLIIELIKDYIPSYPVIKVLTSDIIKSGKWKEISIPPYDVTASPPVIFIGKKHPYLEFLEEVKEILISMGFEEAKGPYVESEFWNFDILFQAQDHPARTIHDNFQVKGVLPIIDAPEELISNVKNIHENGGSTGSRGWRYNWSREIASRPILRSQTTAVSVRFLYKNKTPPIKMFCLSKVFRPDVIDSKHMVEFCQLEGIIGDYGINIRHLLGILTEFANQLGFKEIKFKPSYFPFTEPSIEAYVRHPKLGWIECLGAGLFRPEVTKPLGIDFPVIAWAFGIDRLAMIKLGIDDIRELHTYNLKKLREWGYEIAKD